MSASRFDHTTVLDNRPLLPSETGLVFGPARDVAFSYLSETVRTNPIVAPLDPLRGSPAQDKSYTNLKVIGKKANSLTPSLEPTFYSGRPDSDKHLAFVVPRYA